MRGAGRDGDEARPGAQGGLAGEQHRTAHVGVAADDEQPPEVAFVGAWRARQRRQPGACRHANALARVGRRRDAKVIEPHLAHIVHCRARDETQLQRHERDGEVGPHRRVGEQAAGVGVHAGGHI